MQYKKRLGQHFLVDQNTIDKLVNHIKPLESEKFLEIGPGDGALTKSVINRINKLTLVEKDSNLIKNLYEIMIKEGKSSLDHSALYLLIKKL